MPSVTHQARKYSRGRQRQLSAENLVNAYFEGSADSDQGGVIHSTPGWELYSTIDADKLTRGIITITDTQQVYCVIGTTLYLLPSNGSAVSKGSVGGSGRVSMSYNGTELVITTEFISYVYNPATEVLSSITDPDFPNADFNTTLNGFFIFNNNESGSEGQFFVSALRDGASYDALDFATAEAYPDKLVRPYANRSELIMFGEDSIEIWFGVDSADFPFARAQGSIVEVGLGAPHTVEKVAETVFFLDDDGIVRSLTGVNAQRVSTHDIEYEIGSRDWRNATAWRYVEEGHEFYVLTIPKSDSEETAITLVFDAATGLWHQRRAYDQDDLGFYFYTKANDRHIVMGRKGVAYEMSLSKLTEGDNRLITEVTYPQIYMAGNRFKINEIELRADRGQDDGLQAMLRSSYDVLERFRVESWRSMGERGEYGQRIIWRRLGVHRSFTPTIRFSGPVRRTLLGLHYKITPLAGAVR